MTLSDAENESVIASSCNDDSAETVGLRYWFPGGTPHSSDVISEHDDDNQSDPPYTRTPYS